MSQAPAMPLWTDALIGDTTHLSAEEFGAYLLILIATWRNNGEPFADNDARLARICRMTKARWVAKLRPSMVGFFSLSDGSWRQKRLEKEWKYVAELSALQSAKGKRSGEARRLKRNEPRGTVVPPWFEPEGEPNANPQTHTHTQEEETETPTAEIVPLSRAQERDSSYAFGGEVIRLNKGNLDLWRKSFPDIPSLEAELTSIDAWFVDNPASQEKWFHKTAAMLAKKNTEWSEMPPELRRGKWEEELWAMKVRRGDAG